MPLDGRSFMEKQSEIKVEDKKLEVETPAKKETKSLRLRTGVKAGPVVVCW
jgi:hypothetical protein